MPLLQPSFRRRGFVIIIIVSLLGVMAFLAFQMSGQASLSRSLSSVKLEQSQTYLLCRSGVERGLTEIEARLSMVPPDYTSLGTVGFMESFSLGPVKSASNLTTVSVRDPSGAININDGVSAGILALGSGYDATALEPWDFSGIGLKNESGFINLRLRRLLNAYGDALRVWLDPNLGWPQTGFAPPYGLPYTLTSTDARPPYTSSPGSTGLGDHIIGNRPGMGYKRVDEIEFIVNQWSQDTGIDNWLETGQSLYDMIDSDFTVSSFEDREFWSFNSEFGEDRDGDGFPDRPGSVTVSQVATVFMDSSPLDLTNLWGSRHPVALININAASDLVRAAVFYAPTNVSYLCEGMDWLTTATSWTQSDLSSARDSIGTGGPVFHEDNILENGVKYDGSNGVNVQPHRFMSLRDAMVWSRLYRTLAATSAYPLDFNQFKVHLGEIRKISPPERGLHFQDNKRNQDYSGLKTPQPGLFTNITHSPRDLRYVEDKAWFTQRYVEETLPHVFSTVRRLPGFLGAPLALLSPYIQELGGQTRPRRDSINFIMEPNVGMERANRGDFVLRSVEDFVYRAPIPKVCFNSPGIYTIHSTATVDSSFDRLQSDILVEIKIFERKIWRTQDQFVQATDAVDTTGITLGPENPGNTPSEHLGCVGPTPMTSTLPGSPGFKTDLMFNSNLDVETGSSMKAMSPAADPWINPSDTLYNNQNLYGSELETTGSIFGNGSSGNDLRPFGGAMFSSLGHGMFANQFFNDSLYFRPYQMMSSINFPNIEMTGKYFVRGAVSCWVRVPSGYQDVRAKRTIFHLTLYDKIDLDEEDSTLGTLTRKTFVRPTFISAYFQGHDRKDSYNFQPCVVSPYFSVSEYRTPDGYDKDEDLHPDVVNNNLYTIPRAETVTEAATSPYTNGLLHPIASTFLGIPMIQDWEDYWKTQDGAKFTLTNPRDPTCIWQGAPDEAYTYRPGGWVRIVGHWDLNNYDLDKWNKFSLLAQGGSGNSSVDPNDPGTSSGITRSFAFPPHESWYATENSWNSRMVLSLGEMFQYWTFPAGVQVDPVGKHNGQSQYLHDFINAHQNQILPVNRLNSVIDDFMLWTDYGNGFSNFNIEGALEGASPGHNNRYALTQQTYSTTRWSVEPKLPNNARLLAVQPRIYDVPYDSELGEPVEIAWPRIDVEARQSGTLLNPTSREVTVIDGKPRTSPSRYSYADEKVDSNLRLWFIWRSETPWGTSISHPMHVFDAPFIEEFQVDYRTGGLRILQWTEN